MNETSWEPVSSWYNKIVGDKGHYYHKQVILPNLFKRLSINGQSTNSLLDLACGQGILERALPKTMHYTGVDISASLVRSARKTSSPSSEFFIKDITKPLQLLKKDFLYCTILLALQNLDFPLGALKNAHFHLQQEGKLYIVMNHPCFRIPKQSSWEVDRKKRVQYRRIDRYLSSFSTAIQTNPSKETLSKETVSFHHSLSTWSSLFSQAGFLIETIEELCSDKKSEGGCAEMEDYARNEIPLFLTWTLKKL